MDDVEFYRAVIAALVMRAGGTTVLQQNEMDAIYGKVLLETADEGTFELKVVANPHALTDNPNRH